MVMAMVIHTWLYNRVIHISTKGSISLSLTGGVLPCYTTK